MSETANLSTKFQLEQSLYKENQQIRAGTLKEENPLDTSEEFHALCEACRRGDLKSVQEQVSKGVNINARDQYDYTPLILASLCGHFEVVRMLLEQGGRCERDTFQGERCLYNALNDRIRNLLLSYDYSKTTHFLQPLAGHVAGLLSRESPKTADIELETHDANFALHKFVLSARSPYFRNKFAEKSDAAHWKLASTIPSESFSTCIRYLYMGEATTDAFKHLEPDDRRTVLEGVDKLSRQLEIGRLFDNLLQETDRRLARQRRAEELERAAGEITDWFRENVLKNKVTIDSNRADSVRWSKDNAIFADVLLRADEPEEESRDEDMAKGIQSRRAGESGRHSEGLPIGNFRSRSPSRTRQGSRSALFPCHRAMLLRSEMLATMFSSPFREGQKSEYLQIVAIDCSPAVLEIVLTFLYTEKADFPLALALDVLSAADMLFIERLKQRAALLISTLGNGSQSLVESKTLQANVADAEVEEGPLNIYDVVRAGWDTRTPRLEEFGARYIAYRLERYIDQEEFAELVRESASRVKERQETDTVELVDDIRYYLSERFRLRFEDSGLDEMMDETAQMLNARVLDLEAVEDEGYSGTPPQDLQTSSNDDLTTDIHALDSGTGVVRTLDGEVAGDDFAQDAYNYQLLLTKIDGLLDQLRLDA